MGSKKKCAPPIIAQVDSGTVFIRYCSFVDHPVILLLEKSSIDQDDSTDKLQLTLVDNEAKNTLEMGMSCGDHLDIPFVETTGDIVDLLKRCCIHGNTREFKGC